MQITLDSTLQQRGRRRASSLGVSFAEYVRRLIANDLGDVPMRVDPSIVFNLGASADPTDVARDKDKLLGEAIAAELTRKSRARN